MSKDQEAFNAGYRAYQVRRGLNPYPMIVNGTEWEEYEKGWAQAYVDNAPDLAREEVERRLEATGLTCYEVAIAARKGQP